MIEYGSAREIRMGVRELLRPPTHTTVAESAARVLKIVDPSGARENWNPETAPYMVEPMNMVRSRIYEGLAFVGPARSGKTIALSDCVLAYTIADDPADCMVVEKSQKDAGDYGELRIRRTLRGSPLLRAKMGKRANDDNAFRKIMASGMSIRFAWPSLAPLSGKEIKRIIIVDADNATGDMALSESWGLAVKRTQTYMSAGFCIAESSPAKDYDDPQWTPSHPHEAPPAKGILSLYAQGDQRMYYVPCPHCGEYFCMKPGVDLFCLPSFDELVRMFRQDSPDVAALAAQHSCIWCPTMGCGAQIDQTHKRRMLIAGRWVPRGQSIARDGTLSGDAIVTKTPSYWLGGVAAAYQSWESLVERYLRAVAQFAINAESEPLKTTLNVDQAMPFIDPAIRKRASAALTQDQREDYPQSLVPAGARFLVATIDVQAGQRRGFVVQVMAYGAHRERWIIDRYALRHSERRGSDGELLPCDPAGYVEDWNRLIEKCITRAYPLADGSGRVMAVRLTACDSGGEDGVTARAYDFHRHVQRLGLDHKFRLVKGDGTGPRVHESFPDVRGRSDRNSGAAGDVPVLIVNTDTIKDAIAADLERKTPGPGYLHIPRWMEPAQVKELTAETKTAKGWVKRSGAKNETLDLCVYSEACYTALKADTIDWRNPPAWAGEWDVNELVTKPGEPPKEPGIQRRKSTFWGG